MMQPDAGDEVDSGAASLQHHAVRGSLFSLIATVVSLPITLLSVVVAGRFLGPTGFGRYSLYGFVVVVGLLVIDFGLTSSQTWAATAGRAARDDLLERSLRGCLTWNVAKIPVTLVGVGWLLRDEPGAAILLGAGVAAQLLGQAYSVAITADRDYGALARIGLAHAVVGAVGVSFLAVATTSPAWTIAGFWAGRIAVLPLLAWSTPTDLRHHCRTPGTIRMDRKSLLFGGSSYLSSMLSTWVAGRSELLFLERAGGGEPQGRFALTTSVAARATLFADALYGPLGIAMLAVRTTDSARFTEAFVRALRLTSLLAMGTASVLTSAAALLAPPLFGSAYGSVVLATAVLLQVALLRTACQPLLSWVYTERINRALLVPGMVAVLVDVVLSVLLIPRSPFAGAVIANAASAVVFLLTTALAARLPADARRELAVTVLRFLLVATAVTAVIFVPWPWSGASWPSLILHALSSTMAGILVSTILLRMLPPLFTVTQMQSIRSTLPVRLRPAFRIACLLYGGRRQAEGPP